MDILYAPHGKKKGQKEMEKKKSSKIKRIYIINKGNALCKIRFMSKLFFCDCSMSIFSTIKKLKNQENNVQPSPNTFHFSPQYLSCHL